MSEADNTEPSANASRASPPAQPPGLLFRATEIGLGVASAVSLVMSFIPGVNLIGALIQAGVTLVQTGMDLVTKGVKKAALSFTTGALLTAASFIPFLREAGALAKGAAAAEEGAQAAGFFSRIFSFLGRIKDTIGGGISWAVENTVGRIPGVTGGLNALRRTQTGMITQATGDGVGKTLMEAVKKYPKTAGVTEAGLMVGGMGLSFIGDTPPMNLAHGETWTGREAARREAALQPAGALPPGQAAAAGPRAFGERLLAERSAPPAEPLPG